MNKTPRVPITSKQYQLLASPIRLRILHLLGDQPQTAKQVADALGETRGNVHYHIQRLLAGDIIQLVDTRPVGGVTEKYYQARATRFTSGGGAPPQHGLLTMSTWLSLSLDEAETLLEQVEVVLAGWEKRMPQDSTPRRDYEVTLRIQVMDKPQ